MNNAQNPTQLQFQLLLFIFTSSLIQITTQRSHTQFYLIPTLKLTDQHALKIALISHTKPLFNHDS